MPESAVPRSTWASSPVEAFDRDNAPAILSPEEVAAIRSASESALADGAAAGVVPLSEVLEVIAAREAALSEAQVCRDAARLEAAQFADTGSAGADLRADDLLRRAADLEARAARLNPALHGQSVTASRSGFRLTEAVGAALLSKCKASAWRCYLAYGGRAENPAIDPYDSASAAVAEMVQAYADGEVESLDHLFGAGVLRARFRTASAIRSTWNPKRWPTQIPHDGLLVPAPVMASKSQEAADRAARVRQGVQAADAHLAAEILTSAVGAVLRREPEESATAHGKRHRVAGISRFLLALKSGASVAQASERAGWSREKGRQVRSALAAKALEFGAAEVLRAR